MKTEDFLVEADKNYNHELCLLGSEFHGPGYHSRIPDGTWTHSTRDSIYYALHLLKSGGKEYEQRAFDIIKTIISLQDTNPYNLTYGIWSWLYEEPLEKMSPPDWNWADFIGAALAHILKEFSDRLPEPLRKDTAAGIGHAAWSIFRRNVRPGYTNIAVMGVVVTAVAGEVLNEPRLVEYARFRINKVLDYTLEQGGLNEYNCGYTFVALHEVERVARLVEDREIKEVADKLRCFIWKGLSDHYHPGTRQLAGPHSRSYSDLLKESTVHYLDRALSGKCGTEHEIEGVTDFVTHLPCPDEYLQRFFTLPVPELEQKDCFIKKQSYESSFHGTTWMNYEAALGSISHECFWAQRHPLIGYWNDTDGQVAVLRLRMLKDGRDFSSGGLHNTQVKNKVLTGIKMYIDRGDFHIHLDRPVNGIFKFKSLVLRYELTGADAGVCSLGQNQFELSSGKWKAAITTLPGEFNGFPVIWRTGKTPDSAYLEAVLYEGDERGILFDDSLFTKLLLCTELIRKEELATKSAPVIHDDSRRFDVTWQGLALTYNPYGENYEQP